MIKIHKAPFLQHGVCVLGHETHTCWENSGAAARVLGWPAAALRAAPCWRCCQARQKRISRHTERQPAHPKHRTLGTQTSNLPFPSRSSAHACSAPSHRLAPSQTQAPWTGSLEAPRSAWRALFRHASIYQAEAYRALQLVALPRGALQPLWLPPSRPGSGLDGIDGAGGRGRRRRLGRRLVLLRHLRVQVGAQQRDARACMQARLFEHARGRHAETGR